MNLRILVVESIPDDLLFLKDVLEELDGSPHWTTWTHVTPLYASSWAEAHDHLSSESVPVVLLNPQIENCQGAATFRKCQTLAPQSAVVLLLNADGLPLAEQLLREGAQDFIVKSEIDCAPLARTIRNAVERHRLVAALRSVAMVDALTGLLSRDAFILLAERDLRLAERLGRRVMLVLAEPSVTSLEPLDRDLDLIRAAEQLRSLAGTLDLVARLGPERLAVNILDTDQESAEAAWARMHTASLQLHIKLGVAVFDPGRGIELQELIARAEHDLEPCALAAAT